MAQLLHRLGFSHKLTTPVPREADPARQAAFLAQQPGPLLAQAEAARPPHNTRSARGWTRCGQPLALAHG